MGPEAKLRYLWSYLHDDVRLGEQEWVAARHCQLKWRMPEMAFDPSGRRPRVGNSLSMFWCLGLQKLFLAGVHICAHSLFKKPHGVGPVHAMHDICWCSHQPFAQMYKWSVCVNARTDGVRICANRPHLLSPTDRGFHTVFSSMNFEAFMAIVSGLFRTPTFFLFKQWLQ